MYWAVYKDKTKCLHETFAEAWEDWKSHSGDVRWIYPVLMHRIKWDNIKDFEGW